MDKDEAIIKINIIPKSFCLNFLLLNMQYSAAGDLATKEKAAILILAVNPL